MTGAGSKLGDGNALGEDMENIGGEWKYGRGEKCKDEGCIPIVMIMVGDSCARQQIDDGNDKMARRQTTYRMLVTHVRSL